MAARRAEQDALNTVQTAARAGSMGTYLGARRDYAEAARFHADMIWEHCKALRIQRNSHLK